MDRARLGRVLADDLSGAAEVAACFGLRTRRSHVLLGPVGDIGRDITRADGEQAHVVLDLDSRGRAVSPSDVHAVRAMVAATRSPDLLFQKVDSLLRGAPGAHLDTFREHGRSVVVATALPVAGRTVRGGVLHLADGPLHRTDAWRAETAAPPRSVGEVLSPAATQVVELAAVRAGPGALAATLTAVAATGSVAVCDAETDADLDLVAAAGLLVPDACLVGSGGLAAAVGRALHGTAGLRSDPVLAPCRVLVVSGSAEPAVARQRQLLAERSAGGGRPVTLVDAGVEALLDSDGHAIVDRTAVALLAGTCVLSLHSRDGLDPRRSAEIVRRLAAVTAAAVARAEAELGTGEPAVGLALTGGETARRVLDAMGVRRLTPVREIHHGAVCSRTDDGRLVVTRPGSFGDADSLDRIVTFLRKAQP